MHYPISDRRATRLSATFNTIVVGALVASILAAALAYNTPFAGRHRDAAMYVLLCLFASIIGNGVWFSCVLDSLPWGRLGRTGLDRLSSLCSTYPVLARGMTHLATPGFSGRNADLARAERQVAKTREAEAAEQVVASVRRAMAGGAA